MLTDETKFELISINEDLNKLANKFSEVCKKIKCQDCPYGGKTGISFFCLKEVIITSHERGYRELGIKERDIINYLDKLEHDVNMIYYNPDHDNFELKKSIKIMKDYLSYASGERIPKEKLEKYYNHIQAIERWI